VFMIKTAAHCLSELTNDDVCSYINSTHCHVIFFILIFYQQTESLRGQVAFSVFTASLTTVHTRRSPRAAELGGTE
jgi:hypothetical protein